MGCDPKVCGVDVPYEERPHWSWSGFTWFRKQIAALVNIDLPKMEGYGGETKWPELDDPILFLLRQPDCDSRMSPAKCAKVGPRLAELVEKLPDCPVTNNYDKENGRLLANVMSIAAKKKKPLSFG